MELSELLVCYILTSYLRLLFYNLFQIFDYFGSKKINLWTYIFCQFLRGPNEFANFCTAFSSGKISFKKSPKAKIWGSWKKSVCLFCLFCTEKLNNLIGFCYYLEDKGLNYQVSTENKHKIKKNPANLPLLAKNSQIL